MVCRCHTVTSTFIEKEESINAGVILNLYKNGDLL